MQDLERLRFDEHGLLPAVVQDWRDGTVLMVGFMNAEAVRRTVETGSVHFWSRSRQKLWEKGETSGNRLHLKELFVDCDQDTVLVKAEPTGPTCHTGEWACFFTKLPEEGKGAEGKTHNAQGGILEAIHRTIRDRMGSQKSGSYVTSLFEGGQDRILKKLVEEAGEVVLASKNQKREEVIYEVADLFFHVLVVLGYHDLSLQDIHRELAGRFGHSGLRQKKEGRTQG